MVDISSSGTGKPTRTALLLPQERCRMNRLSSGIAAPDGDGLYLAVEGLHGIRKSVADYLCCLSHSDPEEAKGRWTPYRPLGRHVDCNCCCSSSDG